MTERTTGCGLRCCGVALMAASLMSVVFAGFSEAVLVALEVSEVEGVGGAELEVDELVARFEEEVDATAGVDLEVVAALGADVEVFDEVLFEDGLGAPGALDPEALGAGAVFLGSLTISLSSRLNQARISLLSSPQPF